jgi:hypothetical protein
VLAAGKRECGVWKYDPFLLAVLRELKKDFWIGLWVAEIGECQ